MTHTNAVHTHYSHTIAELAKAYWMISLMWRGDIPNDITTQDAIRFVAFIIDRNECRSYRLYSLAKSLLEEIIYQPTKQTEERDHG